jgi:hypothetical protein
MRYRLMATYRGSPFEAGVGPTDGDIVLFAACPPPEELGFEPATGHWRKQVRINDVQAVWESRPLGTFRGERCMVLDDLGDRLHIGYLGHDEYEAEQLGYWQVDRGVFELVAPRAQVTEIVEERVSYPPRVATPGPAAAAGGSDYAGPLDPLARRDEVPRHDTSQFSFVPPFDKAGDAAFAQSLAPQGYLPVPDEVSGVALPEPTQAPLPLEAEAMRAASASRRTRPRPTAAAPAQPPVQAAAQPAATPLVQPLPPMPPSQPPNSKSPTAKSPRRASGSAPAGRASSADQPADSGAERRGTRQSLATEELFAELAGMAGIAPDAYAVGAELDGAMCLLQTPDGFEVFHASGGSRHEIQVFSTEEAACFYLFGLLVADAVRSGSLLPAAGRLV